MVYGAPLIYQKPFANRDLGNTLFQLNSFDSNLEESQLSEDKDKNWLHVLLPTNSSHLMKTSLVAFFLDETSC